MYTTYLPTARFRMTRVTKMRQHYISCLSVFSGEYLGVGNSEKDAVDVRFLTAWRQGDMHARASLPSRASMKPLQSETAP